MVSFALIYVGYFFPTWNFRKKIEFDEEFQKNVFKFLLKSEEHL